MIPVFPKSLVNRCTNRTSAHRQRAFAFNHAAQCGNFTRKGPDADENLLMSKPTTAQQIVDRIKNQLGPAWKESPRDIFSAGQAETPITGIVTSYTPSIEVLKRSVAAGKNLIITQQPAFYQENWDNLKNDPAYLFKQEFIDKNALVIWRFYDNWNSREVDGQLLGLANALGWDAAPGRDSSATAPRADKNNRYFSLPERSLSDLVTEIKDRLDAQALRVIGDPETKIRKASLSHGMFQFSEMQEILKDPEVNLLVISEAIEWESCEYFRDLLTWQGENKAMILLGREVSEDPGYGEAASWLRTFISEVPIEWIPAQEPFWIP
jgi:putative NIF3 family GTP cyclohydrolase 1 type 2